ncbi:alpha/beta fold hydrolase [Floccifex sp.]|uniref:alpha/beta fold hydrolase n=1 Tax=Floccifex sp. TaxID=2815810 RepID=UPI003F11E9A5
MERIFTFYSKQDGLKLEGIYMEPEIEKKGLIQIVHGMAEHKERYLSFMRFLCQQGYVVFIHDHRGHGQSVKENDDLGYFYDNTGTYIYLDAHDIAMKFKQKYQLPLIVFGHSMGSLVVREMLKYFDKDMDALIVCGSPSENKSISLALTLNKVLTKIKGEHHRSQLMNSLAFSSYSKRFKEKDKNCWLSTNQENVSQYNRDPLCGFCFTLNGFFNLFCLMKDVYDPDNWQVKHKDIPIFFIAGKDDPCIGSYSQWIQAQDFLKQRGYLSIQNQIYENNRHEILNEDNYLDVYQDVLSFIKAVV